MPYSDLPHPDIAPYDYLPRGGTAEEYNRISRHAYDHMGSRSPSWWGDVYRLARGALAAARQGGRYGRPHDPLVGEPLPVGDPGCDCSRCLGHRGDAESWVAPLGG